MAIFEKKTEYWGLKDPLEVRVQHGTCIYMGDTFSSHFEPKKFNRVGRGGPKQPKWSIFGGTNILTSNRSIGPAPIYRDINFCPKVPSRAMWVRSRDISSEYYSVRGIDCAEYKFYILQSCSSGCLVWIPIYGGINHWGPQLETISTARSGGPLVAQSPADDAL